MNPSVATVAAAVLDSTTIIMGLLGAMQLLLMAVATLIGWAVKGLFDRIKSLEGADNALAAQVSALRELLPTNYVRREDQKVQGDAIFDALRRIEDKLDKKVDKPNH